MDDSFVAFDTETTGFDANARILEVALVVFKGGEIVERWESLLNPEGVDWESDGVKKAMEVNKIDRKSLEGKPTFADIFHRLIIHFRAAPVWVAHNTDFDLRMLQQEYKRMNGGEFPLVPKLALCTMLLSREIHSNEKVHKLGNTAARWDVTPDGEHRAASDAITCGRILLAMRAKKALPEGFDELETFYKQAAARRRR